MPSQSTELGQMGKAARGKRGAVRIASIVEIAAAHGLGYWVERLGLSHYLPWKRAAERVEDLPPEKLARTLRLMLQDLGPTFVKVGQLISVRPDIAPPEVVFELEKLQDEVQPFAFAVVLKEMERALGPKLMADFERVDPEPVASASIGQVHRATLGTGQDVAVKVQRPEAQKTIEADLDLLAALARLVKDRVTGVDPVALVNEFSAWILRELDYRVEGKHIDRFRFNFRDDPLVKIPLVYWKYTGRRVLTMEFVEGTKLSDLATPEAAGIDTFELARHGAEAFMKQVLVDGFFHGDLHAANMMVTPDGRIGYLDFGIVGTISPEHREPITRMLLGIIRQDMDEVVIQAERVGAAIPPDKRKAMAREMGQIVGRYRDSSLRELRLDIIGREFLGMLYRNHIRIPDNYALLAKALVTIEGTAKQLYPDINILEVAQPFAAGLVRERYSGQMAAEDVYQEILRTGGALLDIPKQAQALMRAMRDGNLEVRQRPVGWESIMRRLEGAVGRLAVAVLLAGALVGAAVLLTAGVGSGAAFVFGGLVLAAMLVIILAGRRRRE